MFVSGLIMAHFKKINLSATPTLKRIALRNPLNVALKRGTEMHKLEQKLQADIRKLKRALISADDLLACYVPGMSPSIERYCDEYEKAMGSVSAIIGEMEADMPKRKRK